MCKPTLRASKARDHSPGTEAVSNFCSQWPRFHWWPRFSELFYSLGHWNPGTSLTEELSSSLGNPTEVSTGSKSSGNETSSKVGAKPKKWAWSFLCEKWVLPINARSPSTCPLLVDVIYSFGCLEVSSLYADVSQLPVWTKKVHFEHPKSRKLPISLILFGFCSVPFPPHKHFYSVDIFPHLGLLLTILNIVLIIHSLSCFLSTGKTNKALPLQTQTKRLS